MFAGLYIKERVIHYCYGKEVVTADFRIRGDGEHSSGVDEPLSFMSCLRLNRTYEVVF